MLITENYYLYLCYNDDTRIMKEGKAEWGGRVIY